MYRRDVLAPALRSTVARWLETGTFAGRAARLVAGAHAAFATRAVARPLRIPTHLADGARLVTIAVGGATLGGSGRTRVALACARELASCGVQTVLVGHAYGATPGAARIVRADDALADVGDEALACARELAPLSDVRVVVAATRQSAIDFVVTLEPQVEAIVIDGPLQLAPVRASISVLALDAESPWGAGDVPPAGDLRAPRRALLAHADHVVYVDALPRGARLDDGSRHSLDLGSLRSSFTGSRIGLFTALARPDRLERALAREGIAPAEVVRAVDHGPLTSILHRRLVDSRVDLWLATAKCATHLEGVELGAPLAILDGSLVLPLVLRRALGGVLRRGDANRIVP
ncbi:MAG: Tetraacyldisaccharide 4-kinase [Myxococcaceae bacterium]|nr:Tetraacyldisaccharide 4-kinase [Myxococcaceae bacterium]